MTKDKAEVKSLPIIGIGGHGRIVADTAAMAGNFQVRGFGDDDPKKHGLIIDNLAVLDSWRNVDVEQFVVAIGNNETRRPK